MPQGLWLNLENGWLGLRVGKVITYNLLTVATAVARQWGFCGSWVHTKIQLLI